MALDNATVAFAKLAGIRRALDGVLAQRTGIGNQIPDHYAPDQVSSYFQAAERTVQALRDRLPDLYADFPARDISPGVAMLAPREPHYGRRQVEALARDIDQVFEIRSHSELAAPLAGPAEPRVFLSHGRATDWLAVQTYIERDVQIRTLELAQEPNLGRTVLQKLEQEARRCTSAVIVMTGDDRDAAGNAQARQNVMHEMGYFQGLFGLSGVCLLHEESTLIPSNIHGVVYIPFTKGHIDASFVALRRELDSYYKR